MSRLPLFLFVFITAFHTTVKGQFFSFSQDVSTEVFVDGEKIAHPFCGAYNSGQFCSCDLNNDGRNDLIIFDKASRKSLTFINRLVNGNPIWVYEADFEDIIPPIDSWIASADFNCDGKKDLFTQTSAGIKVFRNVSDSPGQIAFVLEVDGLLSQGFNGMVNIQVNPYGAPAFTDVDGDGDLDILTFDFSGNTVEYHKNRILETTGSCSGFQLKKDSCVFGLFATKPACGQIRMNTGCFGQRPAKGGDSPVVPEVPARIQHIGSQLSALDLDADGDKDLLVGDLACPLLNRLINGGTASSALITQADTLFPDPQQYVKISMFPSAYQVDANFDGVEDLVITPTFFSNYSDGFANNSKIGTHLYLNQNSSGPPSFQLVERDFIQNQSIETGEEAVPAFADADGDGDQDLFVGHLGIRNGGILQSSVYFYRNTGSTLQARFALESTDYLGLSTLAAKRIRPVFHDFNGDGAVDFGWISSPGTIQTDSTRLRFLLNQNPAGQPFAFLPLGQARLFPFIFSLFDCPVFTDIDGDLAKDLLVAKYAGRLQYWRQTAGWPSFQYELVNNNYGNIVRTPFSTNPCIAVADADQNGNPDLVVGDFTGQLKWYRDFKSNATNTFAADSITYFNRLYNQKISHLWGNFASPALADLNGDGFPEMAIGLNGGGLNLLVNRLGPNQTKETERYQPWTVYPNPVLLNSRLQWTGPKPDQLVLFNAIGQVSKPLMAEESGVIQLPEGLSPGLYHLAFIKSGMRQIFRLQIQKHE